MSVVSPSQSNPGDEITAAAINNPVNQIAAVINGNIDANNIADSSITTAKLADGSVAGVKLAGGGAWTSWTPTWSNFTVGNAVVTARYTQVGKIVHARLMLVLGTTSPISGSLAFTLPVTALAAYGTDLYKIGEAFYEDVGVNAYHGGVFAATGAGAASTTIARLFVYKADGTYLNDTNVNGVAPFSFGAGDKISCLLTYEAA
jgi:hypothetical protein